MRLTPDQRDAAAAILRSNDESFLHLLRVAGLDPARVLKGADLRGVVFTERDDLTGLDLSGCDLRGADLTRATGVQNAAFQNALSDGNTRGLPPPGPPANFSIKVVYEILRRGDVPPPAWWPYVTHLDFKSQRDAVDLNRLIVFESLVSLDISRTGIVDLGPLSNFRNLQELKLRGLSNIDLKPLTSLSKLVQLDLRSSTLTNQQLLGKITSLKILDISKTNASTLNWAVNLPNMDQINISDTSIIDLTPLVYLHNFRINIRASLLEKERERERERERKDRDWLQEISDLVTTTSNISHFASHSSAMLDLHRSISFIISSTSYSIHSSFYDLSGSVIPTLSVWLTRSRRLKGLKEIRSSGIKIHEVSTAQTNGRPQLDVRYHRQRR